MLQTRNAQIESMLQQALRARIGDQRYDAWFGPNARFELRDDALVVTAANEVFADWLRVTYSRIVEELLASVAGVAKPVLFQYEQAPPSAPQSRPVYQDHTQGTIYSPQQDQRSFFPPQQSATQYLPTQSQPAGYPVNYQRPEEPLATPLNYYSASAQTAPLPQEPKRRRGRPRKNPEPETATPIPAQNFPPQPAPFEGNYAASVLAPAMNETFPNEVVPRAESASPGAPYAVGDPNAIYPPDAPRRRGRPRKNPDGPQSRSASFQPQPPTAQPLPAPTSFVDAYSRSLLAAENKLVNGEELSQEELALGAVGDFGEAPRFQSPLNAPKVPAKRGRPKGSVKRPVKQDLFTESGVARDAKGYNFVQAPRETGPRIKTTGDVQGRRFATLSTFVVGPSNSTAHKIVEIIAEQPNFMSPLYVSGPTSVGKTHLLEGLCDAYSRNPAFATKPPLYMTAEQFTTAFIQSLHGGAPFRDRFRNISLFALDDLHFLEGKKSTQTELAYVLDFLKRNNVQVVLTGNRPLVDLPDLREELVTRVQSGLYAEIGAPERETLASILRQMAIERKLIVPDEVCRYVVSRFATHAREISGALNRLYAMHLATGEPITLDFAQNALADLATVAYRNIRLNDVERAVQEVFELEPNSLKSPSRAKKYADPRAIAMWLARKHTRAALAEIGDYFGGRRHTAVLAAQRKVDGWLKDHESVAGGNASYIVVSDAVKTLERTLAQPKG